MKKRKLYWDTTLDPCEYPQNIKEIFFKENIKNRSKYTSWIENLSKNYKQDLDWWLTAPSSRNPFVSNLHKHLSILDTLEKIKNKTKFIDIIFNTKSIFPILENWSKKNNINIKLNFKKKEVKKNNFFFVFNTLVFNIIVFLYIRLFVKKVDLKKRSLNKKIILIDVFQVIYSKNRYYQNLDKKLKDRNKEIFYIPTFIIQKNIFKVFKIINSIKNKNYIFKEHHLNLGDIFFAFLHFYRKNKFKNRFKKYGTWNLSNSVNEEIRDLSDYPSAFISILNYCFFRKLSQKKVKIFKSINWFENQTVDRGWNYGFRKFYPNAETFGYQGFTHYSQYMNTIPAKYEEDAKIIPNKILTIGKAYKKLKKEFFKNTNVLVAPALNYQFLFKNFKKKNKGNILIVLSGIEGPDKKLLEWVSFCLKKEKNLKIKIKPHPVLPIDLLIKKKFVEIKDKIPVLSGSLSKNLMNYNYVVCSGPTSATLESLAYGCFVIVPVLDPCDEINLRSIKIPKNLYKFVYNKLEFSKELRKINIKKANNKKNNNIKNYLFEKLNDKNVKIFF